MADPYKLLGISRDADDTEVKKAYRAMSKKYHPDSNPGNKAAEEVFKQVQSAYEQIMKERRYGYASSGEDESRDSGGFYQDFGFGSAGFAGGFGFGGFSDGFGQNAGAARENDNISKDLRSAAVYINNGYYDQALNVLNSMDADDRNDKWYYYSAIANMGLGNNITALEHARTALSLKPDSYEYRMLVSNIENGNMYYTDRSQDFSVNPLTGGNLCLRIVICNIALNLCVGGGFCCGSGYGGIPFGY